jgi:glycosyltransferase involved in cell wall biosynthesis
LRVSLVTPSFNQAPFLERTLQSVLGQTGDFDLEYLVIDGGSTDGTLDILRRYESRVHWTSEPDQGQSDAINKGLRRATGDIVGWLNSDDVLLPGALARVTERFRNRPETDWLHGRCVIIDERDRVIRRWISTYKDWCSRHYSFARLLSENFVSQMTVFWRRALLDEVGYLDQHLHLAMDYDLWLRLAQRSDPVYISESIACFRWYASSKSGSSFREQFAVECTLARRYAPERHWLHRLKRFKTARAALAYRLLALFQSMKAPQADGRRAVP